MWLQAQETGQFWLVTSFIYGPVCVCTNGPADNSVSQRQDNSCFNHQHLEQAWGRLWDSAWWVGMRGTVILEERYMDPWSVRCVVVWYGPAGVEHQMRGLKQV